MADDRTNAERQRRYIARLKAKAAIGGGVTNAKLEAEHNREQARQAVHQARQQRIEVLEQLMGVYRDLEAVPAALESAYQEQNNPPEANRKTSSGGRSDEKVSTG